MKFSIVVPVHNEAVALASSVSEFLQTLPGALMEILLEVILVENGSTDGTLDTCKCIQEKFPNVVRVCTIPRGSYGEAVKKGMLESRGTHVAILECDLLDQRFLSASAAILDKNQAQFVVGSKRHPQSIDRRPLKRRVLTALYNFIFLRLLIGYPGSDTHGLKSMQGSLAKRLCELAITTDEIFQTEIVLLAWQLGVEIKEIPVQIREIRNPSVSVVRRLPKVVNTVRELQRSLVRIQKQQATAKPV